VRCWVNKKLKARGPGAQAPTPYRLAVLGEPLAERGELGERGSGRPGERPHPAQHRREVHPLGVGNPPAQRVLLTNELFATTVLWSGRKIGAPESPKQVPSPPLPALAPESLTNMSATRFSMSTSRKVAL
jgi:hypothetical protein